MNPSDVIEVDPLLGDCVLSDPLRATALFQSVSETYSRFLVKYQLLLCGRNLIYPIPHLGLLRGHKDTFTC